MNRRNEPQAPYWIMTAEGWVPLLPPMAPAPVPEPMKADSTGALKNNVNLGLVAAFDAIVREAAH
jgi:hypothetical protein